MAHYEERLHNSSPLSESHFFRLRSSGSSLKVSFASSFWALFFLLSLLGLDEGGKVFIVAVTAAQFQSNIIMIKATETGRDGRMLAEDLKLAVFERGEVRELSGAFGSTKGAQKGRNGMCQLECHGCSQVTRWEHSSVLIRNEEETDEECRVRIAFLRLSSSNFNSPRHTTPYLGLVLSFQSVSKQNDISSSEKSGPLNNQRAARGASEERKKSLINEFETRARGWEPSALEVAARVNLFPRKLSAYRQVCRWDIRATISQSFFRRLSRLCLLCHCIKNNLPLH
jgi:hypothetical protein